MDLVDSRAAWTHAKKKRRQPAVGSRVAGWDSHGLRAAAERLIRRGWRFQDPSFALTSQLAARQEKSATVDERSSKTRTTRSDARLAQLICARPDIESQLRA